VPQRVRTDRFENARCRRGILDRPLSRLFIQMVTATHAAARILRLVRRRKHPEPAPAFSGAWIFACERAGQFDSRTFCRTIQTPQRTRVCELFTQRRRHCSRQHRHSVFLPLALANENQSAIKVDIFYAQAKAFHLAHSGAVQQLSNAAFHARNRRKQLLNLVPTQHHR
jgi:hypothetical protein